MNKKIIYTSTILMVFLLIFLFFLFKKENEQLIKIPSESLEINFPESIVLEDDFIYEEKQKEVLIKEKEELKIQLAKEKENISIINSV
jgi:hypothetical protein